MLGLCLLFLYRFKSVRLVCITSCWVLILGLVLLCFDCVLVFGLVWVLVLLRWVACLLLSVWCGFVFGGICGWLMFGV